MHGLNLTCVIHVWHPNVCGCILLQNRKQERLATLELAAQGRLQDHEGGQPSAEAAPTLDKTGWVHADLVKVLRARRAVRSRQPSCAQSASRDPTPRSPRIKQRPGRPGSRSCTARRPLFCDIPCSCRSPRSRDESLQQEPLKVAHSLGASVLHCSQNTSIEWRVFKRSQHLVATLGV